MQRARASVLALIIAFVAETASAIDARIRFADGKAAAGAQVTIQGVPGSWRADAEGRVSLTARPTPPFTLVIVGPRGEIYPHVHVPELPPGGILEISLDPAFRENITVVSGATPNIEAPPAAGTTLVGHEDLEERSPEHLVDAIARVPGVQARGEGPAAVPVIRGLAGGRTLIIFDDLRIVSERRAGPSATFLDPFALASVEISRGPGSVAYGSDALGGVIHARPRDPVPGDPSLAYEVSGQFGAREGFAAGIESSHDVAGGAILALIHARRGDDAEAAGGEPIPDSSFRSFGGALRFVRPAASGAFRVGLSINDARDTGAPGADAVVTRTYYPEEESRLLSVAWDSGPEQRLASIGVRFGVGSYRIVTNRERLPHATITRRIDSATVEATDASFRLTATTITSRGRLLTGFDLVSRFGLNATGQRQTFDAADVLQVTTSEASIESARKGDAGIFVTYDHGVSSKLAVSGGVRADHVRSENRAGFFGNRSHDETAFSGYLAASFVPVTGLTTTIQVSSGYREPTLSDRYFRGVSGRGFVIGNPDLEPERSLQFDGAVRWQRGARSIALLGYDYRIEDLVERFRAGTDFHFRNRGEAEIKGIELELTSPLAFGVSLMAAGAVARGRELDQGAPLDDIAAPNVHIAVRWANDRASAFVHTFFFAEDDRAGPVEVPRPGYATVDVGAGWRMMQWAELRLHARNIGDHRYAGSADANAALAPGRSVTVALNGRF